MVELNKIYLGNALDVLKTLPSESVDCIITSPPYWQLRDYGHDEQIGLEPTFQEYISNLVDIFDEAKRVLKHDGTCWVNLGDTYAGNKKGKTDLKLQYFTAANINKHETTLPNKSLCNIPSRFAIAMQDNGWILRNEIIWHKPNAMPSSVKDRFTIDYEKIFFFVKSQKYYFNQPKEPMITTDLYQANKGVRLVNEYNNTISVRGSKGVLGNQNSGRRKQDIYDRKDQVGLNDRYTTPDNLMRNKRTVWTIPTQPSSIEHFAMFPNELVETMIAAGCKEGGTVLDMFLGSGTTAIVARSLNRDYIGIELNQKYADIAEERLKTVQLSIIGM